VTSEGHPLAFFWRAIKARNVVAAEAAARELPTLTLENALQLVQLYAEKEDARFERAALRWHARLGLEAKGLTVTESQLALGALAALVSPGRAEAARLLTDLLERRHGR
jgi:nitrogen fixation protein FixH